MLPECWYLSTKPHALCVNLTFTAVRSSVSDLVLAFVNPILNFYFTAVVNPDPEVRSSGRVHSAFHLPFARSGTGFASAFYEVQIISFFKNKTMV
jgi:hypothetical protein